MARTVEEIKKEMVDLYLSDKYIKTKYNGGTLKNVSVENVLFYVIAFALWTFEKFIEKEKAEIEEMVTTKMYGTIGWWHTKVLAWQVGDPTVVKNGTVTYDVIDEAKQLVKQVAVVAKDREINIKVAKEVSDELQPLTSEELAMLKTYVQEVKPAGLVTNVVSSPADEISISLEVFYDGELVEADVAAGVMDAVNGYLRALPFNGDIYRSKLSEAIQVVRGVNDVVSYQISIRDYMGVVVNVGRMYSPVSGYYKIADMKIKMIAE